MFQSSLAKRLFLINSESSFIKKEEYAQKMPARLILSPVLGCKSHTTCIFHAKGIRANPHFLKKRKKKSVFCKIHKSSN